MDITTLLGIIIGIFLIISGIKMENIGNFWDIPSIQIVVGGTLAAVVASYPLSILMDIPRHIMVLFRGKSIISRGLLTNWWIWPWLQGRVVCWPWKKRRKRLKIPFLSRVY